MRGVATAAASPPVPAPAPAEVDRCSARSAWAVAVALFAVIAGLVCGPAIVGRSALGPDRTFDDDPLHGALPGEVALVHNDTSAVVIDLPRDLVFARGLGAGRLDAWNPHVACGAPLWAEHGGPFFPLRLPFYLKPSRATHHLFLALRLLLAALGAFALARHRGQSLGAALVAGALFELSGALFAHLAFTSASAVFMLPWVLLGAQQIAFAEDRGQRARATVGAALALGLAGHGGHPTLVAMVLSTFALSSVGHALSLSLSRRVPARAAASLAHAALAGLLGLALAAPALLPLAELARAGLSYKDTRWGDRIWSGDLARFRATTPLALFTPHLLGTLRPQLDPLFPYLFAPALGVLGLLLGLTGLLAGALPPSLLLPLVLGVSLAVAPPGLAWVHGLPVLRLIMPQYPWALVHLPLAIGAGAALDALVSLGGGAGGRRARRALAGAAVLLVVGAGLLAVDHQDPYRRYDLHQMLRQATSSLGGRVRLALPLALALIVGAAGLIGGRQRSPVAPGSLRSGDADPPVRWWRGGAWWRRRAWLLLGVAAIGELAAIIVPRTRMPVSYGLDRPPTAAVRFLSEQLRDRSSRMFAMPYTVGFPNTPMVWGLDDFREVSALPVRRFVDYLNAIGPPVGFTMQTVARARSPLLDLAAVRWVVVPRLATPPEPLLGGEGQLPLRWFDEHVAIYENLGALPRFRVTHQMRAAGTREEALAHVKDLARGAASPGDPAAVSVEADDEGHFPAPLPGGPPGAEEQVRRIDAAAPGRHDDPDRLLLEARLERDGLVVIADTYYPGWHATVDGRATSIHPVDELFRGVRVAAGQHVIELRYQPRSLRVGGALMALALLGCGLALWLTRAGRRTGRVASVL